MKSEKLEGESLPLAPACKHSYATPSPRGKPLNPHVSVVFNRQFAENGEFQNQTISYYSQNARDFITSTQNVDMTEVQNAFTSLLPAHSHILDFGCGSGRDSLAFLQKGFSVTALDACGEFCQATKDLTQDFFESKKITVLQKTFLELSAVEKYEGVWACSSLLHIPKDDLPQIFKKIETSLKPNGIFYCSFKEGNFEGERNGRFFSDFEEKELCSLIESTTSFSKVKVWKTKDARPDRTESWINAIWKKV